MHDPMLRSLPSPSPNMPSEHLIPGGSKTHLGRWRLRSTKGARGWTYLNEEDTERHPQSLAERYFLGLSLVSQVFIG